MASGYAFIPVHSFGDSGLKTTNLIFYEIFVEIYLLFRMMDIFFSKILFFAWLIQKY